MKAANALAATLAVLLLPALSWHGAPTRDALAHDAAAPGAHAEPGARSSHDLPVVAALRANGAQVTDLGERGGLSGHFVELAEGDAYGLYVTPDGHAVAGLLYGPDGTLLTGRQIAAAHGERDAAAKIPALQPAWRAARNVEVSAAGGRHGAEKSGAAAVDFARALADGPNPSDVRVSRQGNTLGQGNTLVRGDTLFQRAASAFGFSLGRAGPPVVAFADPGCRWSRSAVARLARPALAGRLRLHVVPVGVLGAASAREAAVIASAGDPAMAWFEGTVVAGSAAGARRIERNNALFDAWGPGAVPLIVWQARDGRVAHSLGDIDDLDAWLEVLPHE